MNYTTFLEEEEKSYQESLVEWFNTGNATEMIKQFIRDRDKRLIKFVMEQVNQFQGKYGDCDTELFIADLQDHLDGLTK